MWMYVVIVMVMNTEYIISTTIVYTFCNRISSTRVLYY